MMASFNRLIPPLKSGYNNAQDALRSTVRVPAGGFDDGYCTIGSSNDYGILSTEDCKISQTMLTAEVRSIGPFS